MLARQTVKCLRMFTNPVNSPGKSKNLKFSPKTPTKVSSFKSSRCFVCGQFLPPNSSFYKLSRGDLLSYLQFLLEITITLNTAKPQVSTRLQAMLYRCRFKIENKRTVLITLEKEFRAKYTNSAKNDEQSTTKRLANRSSDRVVKKMKTFASRASLCPSGAGLLSCKSEKKLCFPLGYNHSENKEK